MNIHFWSTIATLDSSLGDCFETFGGYLITRIQHNAPINSHDQIHRPQDDDPFKIQDKILYELVQY